MIGGITTYLIIYIQFYALYGKEGGKTNEASRVQDGTPGIETVPSKAGHVSEAATRNTVMTSRTLTIEKP